SHDQLHVASEVLGSNVGDEQLDVRRLIQHRRNYRDTLDAHAPRLGLPRLSPRDWHVQTVNTTIRRLGNKPLGLRAPAAALLNRTLLGGCERFGRLWNGPSRGPFHGEAKGAGQTVCGRAITK